MTAPTLSPPVGGAKGGGDATMPGATDSNVFSSSYKIYGRQWCGITGGKEKKKGRSSEREGNVARQNTGQFHLSSCDPSVKGSRISAPRLQDRQTILSRAG